MIKEPLCVSRLRRHEVSVHLPLGDIPLSSTRTCSVAVQTVGECCRQDVLGPLKHHIHLQTMVRCGTMLGLGRSPHMQKHNKASHHKRLTRRAQRKEYPVERSAEKPSDQNNGLNQTFSEFGESTPQAFTKAKPVQLQTGDMTTQLGSSPSSRQQVAGAEATVTQQVSRNLGLLKLSPVLILNIGAVSIEWFEFMGRRFARSLDHLNALIRCRTPQDLVNAQSDLLRDHLDDVIHATNRIGQINQQSVVKTVEL
jgi:hypothetical protein